jgi:hypothetical protein
MFRSNKNIFIFLIINILFDFSSLCAFQYEKKISKALNLSKFEKKIFSQNGEDGVIEKIFQTIGVKNKYFVEFGVEDGAECNTRYLREVLGWTGLMMDGSHENCSINLRKEFITAKNINELLKKYGVPLGFDLLSIDIDYNDFYVWYAIKNYRPRVVVIEFNATHLPEEDKVVIYNPNYMWDFTNYYGASILTLAKLGNLKGYTLVYVDRRGVNLFFIRSDILKKFSFKNSGNVQKLYKSPKFGNGPNGGHREDHLHRQYFNFDEACEFIRQNLEESSPH